MGVVVTFVVTMFLLLACNLVSESAYGCPLEKPVDVVSLLVTIHLVLLTALS